MLVGTREHYSSGLRLDGKGPRSSPRRVVTRMAYPTVRRRLRRPARSPTSPTSPTSATSPTSPSGTFADFGSFAVRDVGGFAGRGSGSAGRGGGLADGAAAVG